MQDVIKLKGPRSLWRPKTYHRRVSAALTERGWQLLDHKLKTKKISVGDWIESTLRAEAGEIVEGRQAQ